ncbi:hypothetical protein Moror_12139 [Moniliophthora roreri MCA 2997]|uniref:Uncharacterized protein n=1 Tax=Moniliophthora roreri (strain MCA 2997) TaxID=1381753 RepID=V2W3C0_MONRO|nr:hypothetical protein Moror_12139 [Moniliophthora roreri MCA 2997]
MPLFTGLKAHAVRSATDAGLGRPEMSKEFAKRMTSFVRISGPRRAQEGGSATHQTEIQQNFGSSMPDQPKPSDSSSLETSHKQDEGKERLFIRIPSRSAFKGTETQRTSTMEAVKPPDNINGLAVQDPSDGSHSPGNSAGIGSSTNSNANASPSLVDVVSNATGGIDIRSFIKNKYTDNVFFKKILENPKDFKNFEVTSDGLVYLKHSEYSKVFPIAELTRGPKDVPEAEEAEDGIEVGNIQFPFPLNTDPCPFTLTPTPSLSLPLSLTLYHHPLLLPSPSSSSVTSSSSSYTIEYSNMATSSSTIMDIDKLCFKYLPGHNSSCCIICRSPQEFEIHGQNIHHVYGASHVRLIIKQAETIKMTDGQPPEDVPGYLTFARITNRHWQNYKIPVYDPKHKLIDGPYALTDNNKPIPPLELFHCEPHQCVEQGEEILLPGYTSVPIEDHKTMTSIMLKKALQNERKAKWHCRDRISKRMERNTAKTGALEYICPVEKAKMEETHCLKSSGSRTKRV